MDALFTWDSNVLLWIQENIRNSILTPIFLFITKLGDGGIIWIAFSLLFLILPKYRKVGYSCVTSMIMTFIVVNLFLKNIVARTRPYEVIEGLNRLVPAQSDFSFPSGHSAHAFAVGVVILIMMKKRIGVPIFFLAITMALSRLYIGVHYPTDVMCGIAVGTLMALISIWIVDKKIHRLKQYFQI